VTIDLHADACHARVFLVVDTDQLQCEDTMAAMRQRRDVYISVHESIVMFTGNTRPCNIHAAIILRKKAL